MSESLYDLGRIQARVDRWRWVTAGHGRFTQDIVGLRNALCTDAERLLGEVRRLHDLVDEVRELIPQFEAMSSADAHQCAALLWCVLPESPVSAFLAEGADTGLNARSGQEDFPETLPAAGSHATE